MIVGWDEVRIPTNIQMIKNVGVRLKLTPTYAVLRRNEDKHTADYAIANPPYGLRVQIIMKA